MPRGKRTSFFGWILLVAGIVLFCNYWFALSFNWITLIILLGIGLFLTGIFQRDHGGIFPGTFILLTGLTFNFQECGFIRQSWWELWPLIILFLGVAFITLFIFDPARRGAIIPGILLIAIAFFFLYSPWNWFEIFYYIHRFWPVLLIILGISLIVKSFSSRNQIPPSD